MQLQPTYQSKADLVKKAHSVSTLSHSSDIRLVNSLHYKVLSHVKKNFFYTRNFAFITMGTSKSYYVSVIPMPIWYVLQGIKAGVGVGGGHKGVKGVEAVGRRVT